MESMKPPPLFSLLPTSHTHTCQPDHPKANAVHSGGHLQVTERVKTRNTSPPFWCTCLKETVKQREPWRWGLLTRKRLISPRSRCFNLCCMTSISKIRLQGFLWCGVYFGELNSEPSCLHQDELDSLPDEGIGGAFSHQSNQSRPRSS